MPEPVILALDVASRLGYAVGCAGARPFCGSVLIGGPGIGRGRFLHLLTDWVADQITAHEPALVAVEMPITAGNGNGATARKLVAACGVVEMVCWLRETAWIEAAPSTIRKHFLGSGRAKKDAVLPECLRRGWDVRDADAADAAALFAWACTVRLEIQAAA